MPIKRCVCNICGQEVNKASTFHVGEGQRACKTHQGVQEKRDQLEQRQREEIQKSLRRENAPEPTRSGEYIFKPSCWVCRVTGIRQDEFYTRVLIEREKGRQIYGPVNPFDLSHPANQHGIKEPCIFIVAKEKCLQIIAKIKWDLRSLVDMMNVVALCGQCVHKYNIEVFQKMDMGKLMEFMAAHELIVQPAIEKIASAELRRDN